MVLAGPGGLAMDGCADRGQRIPAVDVGHYRGVGLMESDGCLSRLGVLQAPLELFYAQLERGDITGGAGPSAKQVFSNKPCARSGG